MGSATCADARMPGTVLLCCLLHDCVQRELAVSALVGRENNPDGPDYQQLLSGMEALQ
jgi:hypothetical protein